MNKPLAITGAAAGALCAFFLSVGMPSFGVPFSFDTCTWGSSKASQVRDLSWGGGDTVEIRVPGSVHFKTGPRWRATAEGPPEIIKHLRFRDGRLEFDRSFVNLCDAKLTIELTGPAVRRWIAAASGDLTLEHLNQPEIDLLLTGSGSITAKGAVERTHATLSGSGKLWIEGGAQRDIAVEINGSGTVTASGTAQRLRIAIPGSGRANLDGLMAKEAVVSINGSGMVDLKAENSVDVQINGSGIVRLMNKPQAIRSRINGAGKVISAS